MTEENKEQDFKVLDDDGTEISMNFNTALGMVRSHSAVVVDDSTIQLNSSLQDGHGFNVRRGWRDDHAENNQAWAYSSQNLERDFLLSFDTLRELYRRSSHIRPAIDSIVKEVAHLPVKVVGKGAEIIEDFIERPNISKETWPTLIQKFLTDLLIIDQAVIEKVRSLNGRVPEIYARDATQFKPVLHHTRSFITYFKQEATDRTGKVIAKVSHDVYDIIWTVQFPRTYSVYGTPIIETIVNEVSTLMFSSQSIARGFVDDEIPNGVLWLDQIGKKAYERAKSQFEASRGEKGKKQLKVIDNVGQAGWIPFTRPFREMQLAELTVIIADIVNKNFGVSAMDLGNAKGLTRSTSDALSKNTRSKLFRPLVNLLTLKLNQELVKELAPDAELSFVLEPVVDASTAKELSDAGIITKNEARAVLNFDKVEGGDALAVRVGNQYIVLDASGQPTGGVVNNETSTASATTGNKESVDENDIVDDKKKKKTKEVKEK